MNRTPPTMSGPVHSPWVVVLLTLIGGGAFALLALFRREPDLAWGCTVGGVLSILNYMGLQVLSAKLLGQGEGGMGSFWTWSLLRYGVAVVVLALLVRISVLCLLGALASYLWSLGVLFWVGVKMTGTKDRVR